MTNTKVQSPGTREVILREASQLFAERGFHGTSTRDIAEAVGIRQPSLFHHFPTKNDIMVALQDLEFETSLELLTAASQHNCNAASRLYFVVYLDIRWFLASDYHFTGTTAAAVLNDPAFAGAAKRFSDIQRAQTALIAEGVESGELIDIDPVFANRAVDWTIEGVLVDATRATDVNADEFAELLASFVVRSLLTDTDRLEDVRAEAMTLIAGYTG